MLKLTNYSKLPNIIFNSVELTANEKIMLAYLTNRANNFKREEDWFGVPLCDFGSDIGFTDHHKVSDVRDALLELDLIDYKRGGKGRASQYKIKWDSIYNNLTSRYDVPKNEYEEDIPIPVQQKTEIKLPYIPNGESRELAFQRFSQILKDNLVGDDRFAFDKDYQNNIMEQITDYLSDKYKVSQSVMRANLEQYKNNYIKNTYKTLAV